MSHFRLVCFGLALSLATAAVAQEPAMPVASEGHAHLKRDVGTWDAEMSMDGGATSSKGTEVNSMVGDFWLVSNFNMPDFMGMPFAGHSTMGYDEASGKYLGFWIDSMSPTGMHMEGTWDEAAQTMTCHGKGKGPDGSDVNHKMTTQYKGDDTRVFTMFMPSPEKEGEWMPMMTITYTKKK